MIIKLEFLKRTVLVSPSVNPIKDKIIQTRGKRIMTIPINIGATFRESYCNQRKLESLLTVPDLTS